MALEFFASMKNQTSTLEPDIPQKVHYLNDLSNDIYEVKPLNCQLLIAASTLV